MRDIDKNDVDISQLFRWSKPVEINDTLTGKTATVYVRLIGDKDIGIARAHSYRESAKLRKTLRETDSPEALAFIAGLDEFNEKQTLVDAVLLTRFDHISRIAVEEVNLPEPVEPKSSAPMEKFEEYQILVDEYPKKYEAALREKITELAEKERERFAELSMEILYKNYKDGVISRLCAEEVGRAYYDMVIFLATFRDAKFKTKLFKTFDEYQNISPKLKDMLLNEYRSLELGMGALKKLPEATE